MNNVQEKINQCKRDLKTITKKNNTSEAERMVDLEKKIRDTEAKNKELIKEIK